MLRTSRTATRGVRLLSPGLARTVSGAPAARLSSPARAIVEGDAGTATGSCCGGGGHGHGKGDGGVARAGECSAGGAGRGEASAVGGGAGAGAGAMGAGGAKAGRSSPRSSPLSSSPSPPPPPLSASRLRSDFAHCALLVRELDPESFLWISQLPKDEKAPLLAVHAFDLEVARIEPRATKSEVLGGMRYVWWRDAVNAAYRRSPPDHPVARALSAAVGARPAMGRWRLLKLLARREEGATRRLARQPQTVADLDAETRDVQGNVLALGIEGVQEQEEGRGEGHGGTEKERAGSVEERGAGDAVASGASGGASDSGSAPSSLPLLERPAVAGAVRSLTLALSAGDALRRARRDLELGRTHIPVELCERHGVDWDAVRRGEDCLGLARAAEELAVLARERLAAAREAAPDLPPAVRRQLLPAVALECYLDALEKNRYKLLSQPMLVEPPYLPLTYQLKLKWKLWRGAF